MNPYKRIEELGLTIHFEDRVAYINRDELHAALKGRGMSVSDYADLFGIQTMVLVDGKGQPFPSDVEAVLERMMSGKLTGSQKYWD